LDPLTSDCMEGAGRLQVSAAHRFSVGPSGTPLVRASAARARRKGERERNSSNARSGE
jgi:hypothetical protein